MSWPLHITELNAVLTTLSLFMVAFMLLSSFITEKLFIGPAPIAFIIGIIFGPRVAKFINPLGWGNSDTVILEFSRVVLSLQCFGNAIELPKYYLERHWKSLAWIIGPVMIGGWLITTCCAKLMIPDFDWKQCLACAACFNAIDPVLSETVLKYKFGKRVPKHLKDVLRMEAAANSLTTTVVLDLTSNILKYPSAPKVVVAKTFAVAIGYQSILSIVIGIIAGYSARLMLRSADRRGLVNRPSFLAYYLSVALFGTGLGTMIGSDEVNMAFFAGIGLDNDSWYEERTHQTFLSSCVDLVLNLGYFVFVGTLIPWQSFSSQSLGIYPWRLVLGTLCIFLFRRLPMLLVFKPVIPDIKTWREAAFYGHFGPIGAGSLFSALIIKNNLQSNHSKDLDGTLAETGIMRFLNQLWVVVTFVVLCSSILHGSSIAAFYLTKFINTLTITISLEEHTQASNWMDRLPRIEPYLGLKRLATKTSDPELPRSNLRRAPAQAYQIGQTIIIEDEEGEVIKTIKLPLEQSKKRHRESNVGNSSKLYPGGGQLTTKDFLAKLQDLDPSINVVRNIPNDDAVAESSSSRQITRPYEGSELTAAETPAEARRRLAALGLSADSVDTSSYLSSMGDTEEIDMKGKGPQKRVAFSG